MSDPPNLTDALLTLPDMSHLEPRDRATHAPRILLLYGSLREPSISRFLTLEAERLLRYLGAETRVFDPRGLPLPDSEPADHLKVAELRELSAWSEGQVWTSPERHGAMTGIMKAQIDWIPLAIGAVRPTQGKTLAVMQVSGGSRASPIRSTWKAAAWHRAIYGAIPRCNTWTHSPREKRAQSAELSDCGTICGTQKSA